MSLESIYSGLIFRRTGTTVAFDITEYQFKKAICHTVEHHGVSIAGGFYGGSESSTGAGVSLGSNAHCKDDSGLWIDAIQLGTGINRKPRTLQIYNYQLLDEDGIIPAERLPGGNSTINSRKAIILSDIATVVTPEYKVYVAKPVDNNVSFVLPAPQIVNNLSFTFKLINDDTGFAMTIERSGDSVINVNGEEWLGITSDQLGFWVTITAIGDTYYVIQSSDITVDNNIE